MKTTPNINNKPYRRFSPNLVRDVVSVAVRFATSVPGVLMMFTKLCGAVSTTADPLTVVTLPPIRLAVVLYYLVVVLVLIESLTYLAYTRHLPRVARQSLLASVSRNWYSGASPMQQSTMWMVLAVTATILFAVALFAAPAVLTNWF